MNNMALIFIEQGLFEEALPPLARATELKDNVAVFFNNLGMALECTGQFQAAENAYGSALAIDETYEKAAANLNRVEPVFEEPGLAPVDLAVLAQAFVDEVKSWGVAAASDQQPGSSDPLADGIVVSDAGVSPADSTGNGRDQ
jgi:tetratricopeptide (TPR) repeat protein